jgi:cerevisin
LIAAEYRSPHFIQGLVRVSHREEISFKNFGQYPYNGHGGEGVTAYVIDTGINIDHVDFEGRARWGKTMPANDVDKDNNAHCAGTIGSKTYGVAKKAELVAVKVLGSSGSGSMADVTGGVLWAVEDATKASKAMAMNPASEKARKHRGFVANMSLGGGKSPTLDKAVNGAVTAGMHFAVAAGNENQDACNVSPAGAANPLTVGASTLSDLRASFSNVGKCVDVFAPGLNIKSTWNTGNNSINTISGTSMASPHVVGMLAYLLSIYGSDEFVAINNALPSGHPASLQSAAIQLQDFTSSFASKIRNVLPIPAIVLDAVAGLFGKSSNEQVLFAPTIKEPGVGSVLHPVDMKKALLKLATADKLGDVNGSPNLLIFNNATKSTA